MSRSALMFASVLLAVSPLQAQESACPGEGAEAPQWYTEPSPPPEGRYQAEARSGGCPDAATAQEVAGRLASWLLLHQRSRRALLEQMSRTWTRLDGGDRQTVRQEVRSTEQALLEKILERSWVHRHDTRWTEEGLAEHFIILQADTTALREGTGDALARVVASGEQTLPKGSVHPDAYTWVQLDDQRSPNRNDRPDDGDDLDQAVENPGGPRNISRFVLDWQVAPMGGGEVRTLFDRPQQVRAGLSLAGAASGWTVVLGGGFQTYPSTSLGIRGADASFGMEERVRTSLRMMVKLPGSAVPVYGGVTHVSARAGPIGATERGDGLKRSGSTRGTFGIGIPLIAELQDGWLRNLNLEADLAPNLERLEVGGRTRVAEGLGVDLNLRFRIARSLDRSGITATIGRAIPVVRGAVRISRWAGELGAELTLGETAGISVGWAAATLEPRLLSNSEAKGWLQLFRDAWSLGDRFTRSRLQIGVRFTVAG